MDENLSGRFPSFSQWLKIRDGRREMPERSSRRHLLLSLKPPSPLFEPDLAQCVEASFIEMALLSPVTGSVNRAAMVHPSCNHLQVCTR